VTERERGNIPLASLDARHEIWVKRVLVFFQELVRVVRHVASKVFDEEPLL